MIYSNLGFVLGSTLMNEWVWIEEGSLLWCFYAWGVSSGDVCWLATGFWGAWPPFFAVPSLVFKFAFCADLLMSFGQSCTRWSGLLHLKQLLFFCWYSLTALAKWTIYSIGWSAPPLHCCFDLLLSQRFCLSFFLLQLGVYFTFAISNGHSLSSKSTVALQPMWGEQVPWGLRMYLIQSTGYSWHLKAEVPWTLPFFQVFVWLGAGGSIQQGFHHLPYEPAFTSICE